MPYVDNTSTKKIPRNILVLMIPKTSRYREIFVEKICVKTVIEITKATKSSKLKIPIPDDIMKNHNDEPAETASALNLDTDISILYRIKECYNSALC